MKTITRIKFLALLALIPLLQSCSKDDDTTTTGPFVNAKKCIITHIDGVFFNGSFTLNFLYNAQKQIIRTGLPGDDLSKVSYFLVKYNAAGQISKILNVNNGWAVDTAYKTYEYNVDGLVARVSSYFPTGPTGPSALENVVKYEYTNRKLTKVEDFGKDTTFATHRSVYSYPSANTVLEESYGRPNGSSAFTKNYTKTFILDDKKNPRLLLGVLADYYGYNSLQRFENNILSVTRKDLSTGNSDILTISYQYNSEGFPVSFIYSGNGATEGVFNYHYSCY